CLACCAVTNASYSRGGRAQSRCLSSVWHRGVQARRRRSLPLSEPPSLEVTPTLPGRAEALAPPASARRLGEVRAEQDHSPPPGPERAERCVALCDDERVAEVVVERRRRALSARGSRDLVPDAARRDDEEAVAGLAGPQRPVRVLAVGEELGVE